MESTHALLVVDMQLVAFDGKVTPSVTSGTQVLESVSKLLCVCRTNKIHIVYIQTCAVAGQPYSKDVHGWKIHPRVAPREGDHVVFKRNSSGFDCTGLRDVLNGLGVRTLIVCGIWSEFCVASTSKDAAKLGFEVLVAADAHGTVATSVEAANETVAQQNLHLSELDIAVLEVDDLAVRFANE